MGQGPGHLIAGGAVERLRASGHGTEVIRVAPQDRYPAEIASAFGTAAEVARQVRSAIRQRRFPVILAGNCFSSVGAVAGLPPRGRGLVWFDAHGDLHTPETTTSGFLDGMALASILGHAWTTLSGTVPGFSPLPAGHALLAGTRALDAAEEDAARRWGLPVVPLRTLTERPDLLADAVETLGGSAGAVHLHIDLDVLDPAAAAPANAFTPPDGLAPGALLEILAGLRSRLPLASLTLSSYDPSLDRDGAVRDTALAVLETVVG